MRISDWSSDVCSSDLGGSRRRQRSGRDPMVMHVMAMQLIRIVQAVRNVDDMKIAMGLLATQLGFQYFALTPHVDIVAANGSAIRIHGFPARRADYFDGPSPAVPTPCPRARQLPRAGFPLCRTPG